MYADLESEPVPGKNSCLDSRMDGQIVGRTKLQQFECRCHRDGSWSAPIMPRRSLTIASLVLSV